MSEPLPAAAGDTPPIVRVQTGVRMEKRMVKVLKALAEYHDLSLGDLLEGIVLHAFADRPPFSSDTLGRIEQLKQVYGMDYDLAISHHLTEDAQSVARSPTQEQGG
ncbi:MAG: hypothetical protein ABIV47_23260 [Roseiflexaceae bacterium]